MCVWIGAGIEAFLRINISLSFSNSTWATVCFEMRGSCRQNRNAFLPECLCIRFGNRIGVIFGGRVFRRRNCEMPFSCCDEINWNRRDFQINAFFFLPCLFFDFGNEYKTWLFLSRNPRYSRVQGVGATNQPQIPPQMRQQINQAVGQAVTNAAMNELSNVFASKFK